MMPARSASAPSHAKTPKKTSSATRAGTDTWLKRVWSAQATANRIVAPSAIEPPTVARPWASDVSRVLRQEGPVSRLRFDRSGRPPRLEPLSSYGRMVAYRAGSPRTSARASATPLYVSLDRIRKPAPVGSTMPPTAVVMIGRTSPLLPSFGSSLSPRRVPGCRWPGPAGALRRLGARRQRGPGVRAPGDYDRPGRRRRRSDRSGRHRPDRSGGLGRCVCRRDAATRTLDARAAPAVQRALPHEARATIGRPGG